MRMASKETTMMLNGVQGSMEFASSTSQTRMVGPVGPINRPYVCQCWTNLLDSRCCNCSYTHMWLNAYVYAYVYVYVQCVCVCLCTCIEKWKKIWIWTENVENKCTYGSQGISNTSLNKVIRSPGGNNQVTVNKVCQLWWCFFVVRCFFAVEFLGCDQWEIE